MRKPVILIILVLLISPKLIAQLVSTEETNNHVITGGVQDRSSKQPVEFATIQLLRTTDSVVIATTVSDRKGKFLLDKVAKGNYILRYSFIGYEKVIKVGTNLDFEAGYINNSNGHHSLPV